MKTKIIIMGAGAIGRGYLPWVLDDKKHQFIFVDSNKDTVSLLKKNKQYSTYRVRNNAYEAKVVSVESAFTAEEFNIQDHSNVAACFFSVGPRNVVKASQLLCGTTIPIVLCENEPETVSLTKKIVNHEAVYFAVPDVITSNTAPPDLLNQDPLSITTENGVLYIENAPMNVFGDMQFISKQELLDKQWTAKLYLHNTPHCIAAYLGTLLNKTYVHQAMANPKVTKLVEHAMDEMLQALKLRWEIPHEFLDWYAQKELSRFRCELLFDPIARVAREPLRKLELHGRLIGAAQMCLMLGVLPLNLMKGIVGALLFEDLNDADNHIRLLHEAISIEDFNRYILGLRVGEPIELMLRENMNSIVEELRELHRDE